MPKSPKVLIVYATWTGHTEEIAHILHDSFVKLDCDTKIFECQQVNASQFLDVDICIVASYTFGREGELPDEMYGFYDELANLDLLGKVYGVLGSGDLYYEWYCKAVDDFDVQFQKTGATKGADNLKIDTSADEEDKVRIATFASQLLEKYIKLNS